MIHTVFNGAITLVGLGFLVRHSLWLSSFAWTEAQLLHYQSIVLWERGVWRERCNGVFEGKGRNVTEMMQGVLVFLDEFTQAREKWAHHRLYHFMFTTFLVVQRMIHKVVQTIHAGGNGLPSGDCPWWR